MNKLQITQAAEKYADDNFIDRIVKDEPWPTAKGAFARAFIDGTDFALSHQWVSVDDALPKEYDYVLAHVPKSRFYYECGRVSHWDGEDWYTHDGEYISPDYWMPIPQLNPGKE